MTATLIKPAKVVGNTADAWEDDFPEVPESIPRHKGDGRPKIWLPDCSGKHAYYTRASKFGHAAEDSYRLTRWKMRAVLHGASRDTSIVEIAQAIEDFDDKGLTPEAIARNAALRDQWEAAVDLAMNVTDTKRRARRGTALHVLAQRERAEGRALPFVTGETRAALDAFHRLMAPFEVVGMEGFVVDDEWCVGGSYDELATVREPIEVKVPDPNRKGELIVAAVIEPGERIVVDLKSNRTDRYFGIGYGVQLRTYPRGRPYVHVTEEQLAAGDNGRRDWPGGIAPRQDWALIPWVPIEHPEDATLKWVNLAKGEALGNLAVMVREANRDSYLRDLFIDTKLSEVDPAAAAQVLAAATDTVATVESEAAALVATVEAAPDEEFIAQLYHAHADVWGPEHAAAAGRATARMASDALVELIGEVVDVDGLRALNLGNEAIWTARHDEAAGRAYERITAGRG